MNVKHLSWFTLSLLLVLRGSAAKEQDLEQGQDQHVEAEMTVDMDMATTHMMPSSAAGGQLEKSLEQEEAKIEPKPEPESSKATETNTMEPKPEAGEAGETKSMEQQDIKKKLEGETESSRPKETKSMEMQKTVVEENPELEVDTSTKTESMEQPETETEPNRKPETEPELIQARQAKAVEEHENPTESPAEPKTDKSEAIASMEQQGDKNEAEPEPETSKASEAKAMEETENPTEPPAEPETKLEPSIETTHSMDYQDDAAAPHEATSPETQAPTTPAPTAPAPTTPAPTMPASTTPAPKTAEPAVKQVNLSLPLLPNSCFSCSSYRNGSCLRQPAERQQCSPSSKRFGCYTLFKRDTQLIMRGCTADLTEEGDKYCRQETELCKLCTGPLCNKELAALASAAPFLGSLTIWLLCLIAVLGQV
ncbi:protein TsetseEP [Drosophila novamexicana]|uniref:protein TsetseEP n=1 Tax=Drosophila novamexicana TaxID=47314 RepID=UPI0011E5C642|nr:protein TsetseEP [Drosophila novamexicana]